MILPPVVTGYLLLLSFGRRGPIGGFLDQFFADRVRARSHRRDGARALGIGRDLGGQFLE